ncbi:MAG: flagellin lysine-N-methylase [Oscillospiraceae bacterium]|nr:flagellin lysine-N-methylase [Oscillospiraceae bacterium]
MEILYPKYYKKFSCIAAACPDSCCQEWDVDVDPESAQYYRSLQGPLGDRLRQVLQDTEDGTVMVIEDRRCPMWRQDGLCQIQAELGHQALCQVCREFPRLRHDYGDFMELGLELSCPEAARLILSDEDRDWIAETTAESGEAEYDSETMASLLRSRREFSAFLDTTSLSVPEILTVLLLYAHDVQEELDGGATAVLQPTQNLADGILFAKQSHSVPLQEFFLGLEILTPRWEQRLQQPSATPDWNGQYKLLLRYFISRYWLQAVSDYDLLCRVKLMIAACILIGHLGGNLQETSQLFSKEIENNPDNVEAILDGAYTASALTDLNLLGLLLN